MTIAPTDGAADLRIARPTEDVVAASSGAAVAAGPVEDWLVELGQEELTSEGEETREETVETTWEGAPTSEQKDEIGEAEEFFEDPAQIDWLWERVEDAREAKFEADNAAVGTAPVGGAAAGSAGN